MRGERPSLLKTATGAARLNADIAARQREGASVISDGLTKAALIQHRLIVTLCLKHRNCQEKLREGGVLL
jgi:hypothetical protein